eukprot:11187861-Lingulodinium_polyedra.AAC.1
MNLSCTDTHESIFVHLLVLSRALPQHAAFVKDLYRAQKRTCFAHDCARALIPVSCTERTRDPQARRARA